MQIAWQCELTLDEYVACEGWRSANLARCPLAKSCGGARPEGLGSYERKCPSGVRIARFYCRECHTSFSLLPSFCAASYSSSLAEVEQAIHVWARSPTFDAAAIELRPDIEIQGARRWLRRRVNRVLLVLTFLSTGMNFPEPEMATIDLVALRKKTGDTIHLLPTPVCFAHRPLGYWRDNPRTQHKMGPDSPSPKALKRPP